VIPPWTLFATIVCLSHNFVVLPAGAVSLHGHPENRKLANSGTSGKVDI
jgi:hypothetical protein